MEGGLHGGGGFSRHGKYGWFIIFDKVAMYCTTGRERSSASSKGKRISIG